MLMLGLSVAIAINWLTCCQRFGFFKTAEKHRERAIKDCMTGANTERTEFKRKKYHEGIDAFMVTSKCRNSLCDEPNPKRLEVYYY